jgi:hypothetical protein
MVLKRAIRFSLLAIDYGYQTINLAPEVRRDMIPGGGCGALERIVKGWRSCRYPFNPSLNPALQISHQGSQSRVYDNRILETRETSVAAMCRE